MGAVTRRRGAPARTAACAFALLALLPRPSAATAARHVDPIDERSAAPITTVNDACRRQRAAPTSIPTATSTTPAPHHLAARSRFRRRRAGTFLGDVSPRPRSDAAASLSDCRDRRSPSFAGLLVLCALVWAIARLRAYEPHWMLSLRHAMAEAGFRASATWAEFSDWARLGRDEPRKQARSGPLVPTTIEVEIEVAAAPLFRPVLAGAWSTPTTASSDASATPAQQRRKADEPSPANPTISEQTAPGEALEITRFFTTPGVHPFDTVEWELRDARIGHGDRVAFEQKDVEFPKSWSQNATNIVAQKYFRGQLGSPGARALGQADDRPRGRHDRRLGPRAAATSRPTRTPRPSSTS